MSQEDESADAAFQTEVGVGTSCSKPLRSSKILKNRGKNEHYIFCIIQTLAGPPRVPLPDRPPVL